MAKRRQFPVKHGGDLVGFGVKDHVVEPEVPVDQSGAPVIGGQIALQPRDELVHRGNRPSLGRAVLPGPGCQLPFEIIPCPSEIAKADRLRIDIVERGERLVHRTIDRRARGVGKPGQRRVPVDLARDVAHHHEHAPEGAFGIAHGKDARDRDSRGRQGLDDARLAVHPMRPLQKLARRLRAQHEGAAAGIDPVGRVRLPVAEFLESLAAPEAGHLRLQPRRERRDLRGHHAHPACRARRSCLARLF
mmetsp:Transcript_1306/g.2604  ORF Transcript_1306/g.2604 Transcript_1306/m.2604 type:complete len:247 (-) Transcript_1306:3027-3767(-)